MSAPLEHLIRKGTDYRHFPRGQNTAIYPQTEGFFSSLFSGPKYIVCKGRLINPIDMDGTPLRCHLRDTGEDISVYPELRIVGVKDPRCLAEILIPRYDDQIIAIRERIDGIFRSQLGQRRYAEDIETFSSDDSRGAASILSSIEDELGLSMEWTFQPEPTIREWVRNLSSRTPQSKTVSFNSEIASAEFKLTFSIKVERTDLAHLHCAQSRAALGLTPDEEIERLKARVQENLSPAFRAIVDGITVWNNELLRDLAKDGFITVITQRLAAEFGYRLKLSDFNPVPNDAQIQLINDVDPHVLTQNAYAEYSKVLTDLTLKHAAYLRDPDSRADELEVVEKRIEVVKKIIETSQQAHLQTPQKQAEMLGTVRAPETLELRRKFSDALRLQDKTSTDEGESDQQRYGRKS